MATLSSGHEAVVHDLSDGVLYADWVARHDTLSAWDRAAILRHAGELEARVPFLVVPLVRAGDSAEAWKAVVEAAAAQLYPHWRICLPRDWTAYPWDLPEVRLRWLPSPEQGRHAGRSAFLRRVLAQLEDFEGFILPLPPGARLNERALYEMAVALAATPNAALLYGDEDRLGEDGQRRAPRFKTGFDPALMLGRDALGVPVAYRADLLATLGGLRDDAGPVDVALHDLALRASICVPASRIRHIPVVLCHRAVAQEWDGLAMQQTVRRHLDAIGVREAEVQPAPLAPEWCRVVWPLPQPAPLVSVIIPTRDSAGLLATCVDGLLNRTDYPALELLIVDNGSEAPDAVELLRDLQNDTRVRVLRQPGPFNYSALNNAAAEVARGEVLLLLNNDTAVISGDWLREMVSQLLRPGVGAVGAKLLYADTRVQHAGVVLTPEPLLSHQLRLSARDAPGPQGELALTRTVLAVTAACMAVRRPAYQEVRGLDAQKLQIAFNDVDFCLRLGDHGYRIVWTPFAELMHFESISRGHEDSPEKIARMRRELAVVTSRWVPELRGDPFHNPNLHFGWNGSQLASPPRRERPWMA